MKKIVLVFSLMLCSLVAMSQVPQGLDGIVVEKYYKANAADHGHDGNLAEGAVTYRIYADLKENWEVIMVYADIAKNQRMIFETTATNGFYNETGDGSAFATDIKYADLDEGTLMLDSWISLGAAAKRLTTPAPNGTNYFGIPKTLDNTVNTIAHTDGLIQNATGYDAPAVSVKDGYYTVTTKPTLNPSTASLSSLTSMLDGSSTNNSVTLTDGAWYNNDPVSNQAIGATPENMVLIGQFTTEGVFHFALNLQIRNTLNTTQVEYHAWENPKVGEFLNADLEQTLGMPATPPTVTNLTVTPGSLILGGDVNLSVEANDNIAIDSVVFFRGTTRLGRSSGSGNPYLFTWTSNAVGTFNITAVAYDDEGTPSVPSAIVPLVVLPVPANQPPVVTTLTVPLSANVNTSVTVSAVATDDVSVANIEYTVLGVTTLVPGASNSYTFTTPATEQTIIVKAVAIDNQGSRSEDKIATFNTSDPAGGYKLLSQIVNCNSSDFFYVPVATKGSGVSNAIGFDLIMKYDPTRVRPTGVIRVNRDLIIDSTFASSVTRIAGDSITISLFLNSSAPEDTRFGYTGHQTGKVLRVEFAKTVNFQHNDTANFSVPSFIESYITGTSLNKQVDPGYYISYAEKYFTGTLKFWADNSAVTYTGNPATSLITNIRNWAGTYFVQPDAVKGEFVYDITKGLKIEIVRQVADTTDVQPVINGYDAYLTQKVVLSDPNFRPNVYQMAAMDVNLDGKVSAGDVSQINQRTVKNPAYKEFWQKWNYNDDGTKKAGMGDSFDWTWFTDQDLVNNQTRISDNYPLPDSKAGYHKNLVYMWGKGKDLHVENPLTCPIIYNQEFQGIMLGDVDGSYKNIKKYPDPDARPGIKGEKSSGSDEKPVSAESAVATTGKVVFDLSKAIVNDGFITFPVSLSAEIDVNSLDFAMKFDESKLAFKSVFNHLNNLQSLGYYNESDKTLRVTSFSLQRYTNEASVISLRFELKGEKISNEDIKSVTAYINGNPAGTELTEFDLSAKELDEKILRVFPNPAKSVINVELSENATVQLVDINGKVVLSGILVNAYQRREISLDGLSQGMYLMKFFMKIGDEEYVAIRKIVIKK